MNRRTWIATSAVVLVLAGALSLGAFAEDETAGGPPAMPPPQKKVDHPLAAALVGEWTIDHASAQGLKARGKATFAWALNGTALVETYDMGEAYAGHGVFKFGDDGKSVQAWWFDTMSSEPTHFTGTATEKGFEMRAKDDTRIAYAKTEKGFEFRLAMGDQTFFTDTMTRAGAK
jgi:hypothetical protein